MVLIQSTIYYNLQIFKNAKIAKIGFPPCGNPTTRLTLFLT